MKDRALTKLRRYVEVQVWRAGDPTDSDDDLRMIDDALAAGTTPPAPGRPGEGGGGRDEMSDDTKFGCIWLTAVFLTAPFVWALDAWAISLLWGWFLVPALGIPDLGWIAALGVGLAIRYSVGAGSSHSCDWEERPQKENTRILGKATIYRLLRPPMVVGIGWLFLWVQGR